MIKLNLQNPEKLPTRDGFGKGLVEAGRRDNCVVALCADLAESTRMEWFKKEFPDRYIEIGVAEQNLVTVASGMAAVGKIPFASSYAAFSPGRNYEQIRTTIALNNQPVVVVGSHAGVSVGPDGATHQMLEDIALMRVLPNMTVINPCDSNEAYKATLALAQYGKPAYLRLGRSATPIITSDETPFEIGKAQVFFDNVTTLRQAQGADSVVELVETTEKSVTIIATGALVYEALVAAKKLEEEGISSIVINLATIKPLDTKTILECVKKAPRVVTVEEHQIAGGMGSSVSEFLSQTFPVPMRFVGIEDQFGQSGTPDELIKFYGLDSEGVIKKVKSFFL